MFTNIKTLVQVLKILTVWTLKNSQTHAKKMNWSSYVTIFSMKLEIVHIRMRKF